MYQTVLDFWFNEIKPSQWWEKDSKFDQLITDRFSSLHNQATKCELFHWRDTIEGRLAEIVVLDQFSRNIYRDKPESFVNDALALSLAQSAVEQGLDSTLEQQQCAFLYMPYMHSESLAIHEQAVELYTKLGHESSLDFEIKHKKIIERFGRYPHRNQILGRQSTDEELVFLSEPGSRF